MNTQDAYDTIIKVSRSQKSRGGTFAVFCDKEDYNLKVMHLTERRKAILHKDLEYKFGIQRKELVGVYNMKLTVRDLQDDVDCVIEAHKQKDYNHDHS
jgi:hypothetical protein